MPKAIDTTVVRLGALPGQAAGVARGVVRAPLAVLVTLRDLAESLRTLASSHGPLVVMSERLAELSERGGPLDRLADISETLEGLVALEASLKQLGALEVSLDKIAAVAASLERLADSTESLPELTEAAARLPELVERVRAVEGQVTGIGGQLGQLQPSLDGLAATVAELQGSVVGLDGALAPIGRLAGRLPRSRRRGEAEIP